MAAIRSFRCRRASTLRHVWFNVPRPLRATRTMGSRKLRPPSRAWCACRRRERASLQPLPRLRNVPPRRPARGQRRRARRAVPSHPAALARPLEPAETGSETGSASRAATHCVRRLPAQRRPWPPGRNRSQRASSPPRVRPGVVPPGRSLSLRRSCRRRYPFPRRRHLAYGRHGQDARTGGSGPHPKPFARRTPNRRANSLADGGRSATQLSLRVSC